jgi:hypothetical protein
MAGMYRRGQRAKAGCVEWRNGESKRRDENFPRRWDISRGSESFELDIAETSSNWRILTWHKGCSRRR